MECGVIPHVLGPEPGPRHLEDDSGPQEAPRKLGSKWHDPLPVVVRPRRLEATAEYGCVLTQSIGDMQAVPRTSCV